MPIIHSLLSCGVRVALIVNAIIKPGTTSEKLPPLWRDPGLEPTDFLPAAAAIVPLGGIALLLSRAVMP